MKKIKQLVEKIHSFTKSRLTQIKQFVLSIPRPHLRLKHIWKAAQLLFLVWIVVVLVLGVVIHIYGNQERAESADVIIVLGAGVRRDGLPNRALSRRTHHAADLWFDGKAAYIICTGAQPDNRPNSEAVGCQRLLIQLGVPEEVILIEENSHSTEENAIYAGEIIRENDWQTALVVSDSYHVLRARYIFGMEGLHVTTSPVSSDQIRSQSFYFSSIVREIVALHWQVVKDTFNIPVTHVAGV